MMIEDPRPARRTWPDEFKRDVCRQAKARKRSVAALGRKYGINANLIHNWLKDPRFGGDCDAPLASRSNASPQSVTLLPVDVVDEPAQALTAKRAVITLPSGLSLEVEDCNDLASLLRLVQGL